MVDVRWFDIEKMEDYVGEMLPDDDATMSEIITRLRNPERSAGFVLNKSGNSALRKATENVFGFKNR